MRLIFFGSDDFSATNLEKLISSKHKVQCVVTQPDRPKGRHFKISTSVVKQIALKYDIPVLQPKQADSKEFIKKCKEIPCDMFIVIAYGMILPDEVLSIPKIFCMNLHASLLPKYRGAAPINWAIIKGETVTGVSAIKMNRRLDSGEVISQKEVDILPEDSSVSLKTKLAKVSGELLLETVQSIENGSYKLKSQNETEVTYAPKLTKSHGLINWKNKAQDLHNLVRGLLPWPSAFTYCDRKLLKVLKSQVVSQDSSHGTSGKIVGISQNGIDVATHQGILRLLQVHLESSKPMSAHSFAIGHNIKVGFRFGK